MRVSAREPPKSGLLDYAEKSFRQSLKKITYHKKARFLVQGQGKAKNFGLKTKA